METMTTDVEPRTKDDADAAVAVRVVKVDLEETRLLLAKKLMVTAHDMLDSLDEPYLVYNFGGRDNSYEEHLLDSAPIEVRLAAVRAAGIAFDKATRLVDRSNSGLEAAEGVLDTIAAGFAAAAAAYRASDDAEDTEDAGTE